MTYLKYFKDKKIIDALMGDRPTLQDPLEILRAYSFILLEEVANGLSKEEVMEIMEINIIAIGKLLDQIASKKQIGEGSIESMGFLPCKYGIIEKRIYDDALMMNFFRRFRLFGRNYNMYSDVAYGHYA
jgi:hypothetical protein